MRLRRWEVRATDLDGSPLPGFAGVVNRNPDRFFFRRSAKNAAAFYESKMYLPCRFYVVKVES